jgi:hypothetical protein
MTEENYVTLPIRRGLPEVKVLRQLLTAHNGYIAGGYARYCLSESSAPPKTKDVDVWFKDQADIQPFREELARRGATLIRKIPTSVTYEPPKDWVGCPEINVITAFTGSVYEILKSFDFTVTMAFLGDHNEYGGAHKLFTEHDNAMSLVVNNITCPIGNLKRLLRYANKGYRISAKEMLKYFEAWDNTAPGLKEELEDIVSLPPGEWSQEERDTYWRLVYID